MSKLRFQRPHYFSKHPSRGLRGLYWSVGLMDLGIAAVALFEPIFLFSIGYGLADILFFYVLVYGVYVLLLPLIGKLVGHIGFEHSIFYSQFFLIAGYLLLFGISQISWLFYITPIIFAIQKSLYWPAYHADFAVFPQKGQRGREVGYVETMSMMVFIIGPLVGGLILEWSSFSILFIAASVLFVLSAIPLLHVREIHSKVEMKYGDVFTRLVDTRHRRSFLSYLGFGEELIVLTAWPIFIFTIVPDFLKIGGLVSLATMATALLVLFFGRVTDKYKRASVLRAGTLVYTVSWLFRGFVRTAAGVFALDTVSRASKELLFVPLEAMTYANARQAGPLHYGIFIEQSLGLGKLIAGLAAFFIASYSDDPWMLIFILAGAFTLLYLFKRESPTLAPHPAEPKQH